MRGAGSRTTPGVTKLDRATEAAHSLPSVCELLHKLADLHLSVPITLVLDDARYQKCAVVLATATSLQIELCFLPAYSPHLNLIERLLSTSVCFSVSSGCPSWQAKAPQVHSDF